MKRRVLPQRDPQEQYIRNYFRAFGTNLNSVAYTNAATHYSQYIDVESWIDHHLLNVLAFNVDALRLSAYFYKPRNGKIFFGPIWDFDRALGSTDGRDANPKVWSASGGTDFFTYPWWNRLFRDPDFWQQWIDRYQELRRAQFSTNHLMALFDSLTAQLREAQPRERARWRVALRGGSYDSEIAFSKNWLLRRIEFMDTNFVAAPALSAEGGRIRPGFSLSLSGPARGTIFYTLDGTDPRAPRGELSPSAIEYTGPIRLSQNARVVARVRNLSHRNLTGGVNPPLSSPWSGPVAATYVVETPPLIITELMYHPAPPSGNNAGYAADDFEFIELKNAGSTPMNLNGIRFTQGITFSFSGSEVTNLAPGARVLIVKNRAAFASRYGNVANLAGEFAGTLDNNGERIVLEGSLREPILDFTYRDDWYRITDGLGFSLAIVNEAVAQSSLGAASSWRISQALHGSPGRPDPAPTEFARVLVNEILANPGQGESDTIELFNASSRVVNVGGWLLTDDFRDPARFRIPEGATIAPGGFLVLPERVFNPDKRGFALNASGDALYLFSADAATNLTGYVHGFPFGAADAGVSFGRHVTSTGAEHFVAQAAQSFSSSNSGPRVGPVVISEIMFHPAVIAGTNNLIDEFIELRNITSQSVALFDARATNAWRLDGGVQFRFAPNSVAPPNGSVLVVGFDPAADSAALAAFRAHYGLNAATIILGPFDGRLENTGETLTLLRPAATGGAAVSYTIIDQVEYASEAPWPSGASGTGRSLQRVIASNYGNDPANWQVALPTPGLANPDRLAIDADGDGLPGDWETANGLDPNSAAGDHGASGDFDRDGLSNAQEFLAGTDPRSAASFLKVEALGETGSVKIRFMAVAGKSYSIQYRETLSAGPWLKLQDFSPQSTTAMLEIVDPAARGSAERFYRLVTPRLPE